ncbi:MAG: hypothetical protein Q9184_006388 [Pyrenodesmia sp. 2 TL-2023]
MREHGTLGTPMVTEDFVRLRLGITQFPDVSGPHPFKFQANDPAGNYIVALKIDPRDGKVSSPVTTNTDGKGLAGLIASSQDSVVVDHDVCPNHSSSKYMNWAIVTHAQYLFVANAGSNTLSLFLINPHDPQHPTLIGNPAPTLGETPVTVSYSRKLKTDPTPLPPGPLVLIADIVSNPSSSALFASVRSNGRDPSLLYAYPITAAGAISPARTIAYPSLNATVAEIVTIPRQQASCWVAYAPRYAGYAYVMDAAASDVTVVDARGGKVEEEVGVVHFETPTAGTGALDTKVDREWLYALTDDPVDSRVNVWALESAGRGLRLVQGFEIFREVAMLPYRMGLAVWPAS